MELETHHEEGCRRVQDDQGDIGQAVRWGCTLAALCWLLVALCILWLVR